VEKMKLFPDPSFARMKALQAILLAGSVCLGACGQFPDSLKRPYMTALSPRLQALVEKTKTVCFGRFVIEIPETATVVFGPAEAGPSISFLPGEAGQISRYVAKDLVQVETDRKYFDKEDFASLPLFGKVIDGIVPGQKITFGSKNQVGYYINSYVPVGKDLFVQFIGSVMRENYSAELFNEVASNLRLRAGDEIPAGPGSCIEGGFLPMALEYERVTIGVRLKEFADVHLSVEVQKNQNRLDESQRLELMLKSGEETATANGQGDVCARIKTFRRGERQLGPWKGFEIVARKPAYNGDAEAHEFRFESLGAVHDPLQPRIDVRLDTGVKDNRTARVTPSLTDEEAVALWDRLIGTIRVRQSRDTAPGTSKESKTPLASLIATGESCPESGWWQCHEEENVEGGRRRHFSAGERMPHIVLLGQPNLWEKLTGDGARHELATVWKLVDYDVVAASPLATTGNATVVPADAPEPPSRRASDTMPPSLL
jgi:hypothetical protein